MAQTRNFPGFIILRTALLSLILAETLLYALQLGHIQKDMLWGWTLGIIFHVVGLFLFRKAIGQTVDKFMVFALGGIIIRLFILIISVLIVLVEAFLMVEAFLVGLLTSYFIGTWMEIAWLVSLNRRNVTSDEAECNRNGDNAGRNSHSGG